MPFINWEPKERQGLTASVTFLFVRGWCWMFYDDGDFSLPGHTDSELEVCLAQSTWP